jgi:hypothetical protein
LDNFLHVAPFADSGHPTLDLNTVYVEAAPEVFVVVFHFLYLSPHCQYLLLLVADDTVLPHLHALYTHNLFDSSLLLKT